MRLILQLCTVWENEVAEMFARVVKEMNKCLG
jgi:hypothetical protein